MGKKKFWFCQIGEQAELLLSLKTTVTDLGPIVAAS